VSISEVGTHAYDPQIMLYNPGGKLWANTYDAYNAKLEITNAAAGPWIVKVSVWQSGAGGSYKLTVITLPGPAALSSYTSGDDMLPGATYSGSIYRGDVRVYTFDGVAGKGHTATLKVTLNSRTFDTQIRVFRPGGSEYGGTYGASYTYNVGLVSVSGTYTVLVYRWGAGDTTDSYSISVSGNGVGTPPTPQPVDSLGTRG
jgi:hypothetical protein